MSFSNYLENEILDHIVGKTSYTMPTAYIALCTSDPTDAGTGASMNEVANSGAYARVVTAGGDWNAAASGELRQISTLAGSIASQSSLTGNLITGNILELAGSIDTLANLTANLRSIMGLSGIVAGVSDTTANLGGTFPLSGSIVVQSTLTANLIRVLERITGILATISNRNPIANVSDTRPAGTISNRTFLADIE